MITRPAISATRRYLYTNTIQRQAFTRTPLSSHTFRQRPSQMRLLSASASVSEHAKTYSNQDRLPRLPIPELDKTMEAYVKSLAPLLEQKVCHLRLAQFLSL